MAPNSTIPSQYQITKPLSVGDTAKTFDCVDSQGNEVVVKRALSEAFAHHLKREAELLLTSQMPGVVTLIESDPNGAWLALEKIDGPPIHLWARGKPVGAVVEVLCHLSMTLVNLHGNGIIHGDIKPTNVLVSRDLIPIIIDFGGAARTNDTAPKDGSFTAGFTAPEVLSGAKKTIRSDIYSFGALVYSTITGEPPFRAEDAAALAHLPLVTLPFAPSCINPMIPPILDTITRGLLVKDPKKRIESLAAISKLLANANLEPRRYPRPGLLVSRDLINRAIVSTLDGQTKVVSIFGPLGAGKRLLVREGVDCALQQGFEERAYDDNTLYDPLDKTFKVVMMSPTSADATQKALKILEHATNTLLFIHSSSPLHQLADAGAISFTPEPLTVKEIHKMVRFVVAMTNRPVEELNDKGVSKQIWQQSKGLPSAVHLEICRRMNTNEPDSTVTLIAELPRSTRGVLKHISDTAISIEELAHNASIRPYVLLEHLDLLLAAGLVLTDQNNNITTPSTKM